MFLLNKEKNEAVSLQKSTFGELDLRERQNLQEWIAKNPSILGEELLVVQKEFSGFSDTNERLDLLALDAYGNLVVIENKLDDSGRDVAWQAIKYVSYCATLTKSEVRDIFLRYANLSVDEAETAIVDFLNADSFEEAQINASDQRIILVSATFRKEVTSTVMWLMNHGINIRCIKITPYLHGEEVFLDTEQILPPPDTEELQIKLSQKKKEEAQSNEARQARHNLRYQFWEQALPVIQSKSDVFGNRMPTESDWLGEPAGCAGIRYAAVIRQDFVRAELFIDTKSTDENKAIFDALQKQQEQIELKFGCALIWDRQDSKTPSRIYVMHPEFLLKNEDTWAEAIEFLAIYIFKFKETFTVPLCDVVGKANTK